MSARGGPGMREYRVGEVIAFRSTRAEYGGLSNMAAGFPVMIGACGLRTAEALYQGCRFPHRPDVQRAIAGAASPMTAKAISRQHEQLTRPDWMTVRVRAMRWCLRVKLAFSSSTFGPLLLSTGSKPIVEVSSRDDFWGAYPQDNRLVGRNVLGRLLMELREQLRANAVEDQRSVKPLGISRFLWLGEPIGTLHADQALTTNPAAQASLGTLPGLQ